MAIITKIKNFILDGLLVVFFHIGIIFSLLYGLKIHLYITAYGNSFYSGWVFSSFKACGENLTLKSSTKIRGLKYIIIGDDFIAGSRLRLEAIDKFLVEIYSPLIYIGNNVNINDDCHIGCIDGIEIGDGVLIASKVLIIDHFHGDANLNSIMYAPLERPLVSRGKIKIGNNVWIGEGVVIMPGVNIGDNCIIGANAVVTKSFGVNSVIGGNPAKLIKYLD